MATKPTAPTLRVPLSRPTVVNLSLPAAPANASAALQAAIDDAPDNTRFIFQPQTSLIDSVTVRGRSRLEFCGPSVSHLAPDHLVQWSQAGLPSTYTPMITFEGCRDLWIHDLNFDNPGITTYGGMRFYGGQRIEISDTTFTDSARVAPIGIDRYSYVFGAGRYANEDLWIHGNTITNLQLEVDNGKRVLIEHNTVTRGTQTAGIGVFSLFSGGVLTLALEDYHIYDNLIIDPEPNASGIAIHLDPPNDSNVTFARFRIERNTIQFLSAGRVGISIGTPSVVAATTGNTFDDVAVVDNLVLCDSGITAGEAMRILSSPTSNFYFDRLLIQGNRFLGSGLLDGFADSSIDIRRTKNSVIRDNVLRNGVKGIVLVNVESTQYLNNVSEVVTGPAHSFNFSQGNNVVDGNLYAGTPSEGWHVEEGPAPTDSIVVPVAE